MASAPNRSSSEPLCRLIYRSDTSWDLLSNETLQELSATSAKNNGNKGITGLLVLSGENFLQVLEGPASAVNPLFQTIARDERHENVTLLSYEQIYRRYFEDWAMHVVDLYDLSLGQRDYLKRKYPEKNDCIQIPDDARAAFALLLDGRAVSLSEAERAGG